MAKGFKFVITISANDEESDKRVYCLFQVFLSYFQITSVMEDPMVITKIPILVMDLFPAQMGLPIKWLAQQDFVIMQRRTNVTGPKTYHVVSLLIYFLIFFQSVSFRI